MYFFFSDNIKNVLNTYERLDFAELALNSSADKLCWKLPTENIDEKICIYLGPENLSFFNLTLALKGMYFDLHILCVHESDLFNNNLQ